VANRKKNRVFFGWDFKNKMNFQQTDSPKLRVALQNPQLSGICNAALMIVEFVIQQNTSSFLS
jgi:hypothetical protein